MSAIETFQNIFVINVHFLLKKTYKGIDFIAEISTFHLKQKI